MAADQHNLLERLTAGMVVPYGGDRYAVVSDELAARFQPGDRLLVVQESGDLLHVPAAAHAAAADAVGRAADAFRRLAQVPDSAITRFFDLFAAALESDDVWSGIAAANECDVATARAAGRSTTRLIASDKMRRDMVAGLREWRDSPAGRERLVEGVEHTGWSVSLLTAPLGVVGFVFEGRPNVFADATGVLRSGNTVVFRIGSDALGTAQAIVKGALEPSLRDAGLPEGAVTLLASADRAAGWAMFSDPRLSLAVARGSGRAVSQLGSVARQSGVPASLHGTGGGWLVAAPDADPDVFAAAVFHSLDRKVCNTLNVCCIPRSQPNLVSTFLATLARSGEKDARGYKLHVAEGSRDAIPAGLFAEEAQIRRASGIVVEPRAEMLPVDALGTEWEWEATPEVTLALVDSVNDAVALCNRYSPKLVATLISPDPAAQQRFYDTVDAPFIGNGFTRWVDGLYALGKPELGLSSWQFGRLFARAGVLSGDGIYTVRTRVAQSNPDLHR